MSARGSLVMRATARCRPNHRAMPATVLDRASRSVRVIARCVVVLLALAGCASPAAQPNPVPTASPPPSATPATPPVALATATYGATLSPPASASYRGTQPAFGVPARRVSRVHPRPWEVNVAHASP